MSVSAGIHTVIYPVSDLARAKALYTACLGQAPSFDTPYYVGWRVGDQDIGLDPHGHRKGMTGPVGYLEVPDIRQRLEQLLASGAEQLQAVSDVGGGKLIASVKDADGNIIGLMQSP
jgi:predicted enzyme related to lactoylglutathione lyase